MSTSQETPKQKQAAPQQKQEEKVEVEKPKNNKVDNQKTEVQNE